MVTRHTASVRARCARWGRTRQSHDSQRNQVLDVQNTPQEIQENLRKGARIPGCIVRPKTLHENQHV